MITIITICARGGSKGLPGKNVKPLHGKPLIVHSIEQAQAVPGIAGVFVSTDDEEIARVARAAGAVVPGLRPAELASDTAPKIPVIRHLVDQVKAMGIAVETVVDLDATSPLRRIDDITACLAKLTDDIDVVITAFEAEKNPYFNMIEALPDGGWHTSKQLPGGVTRRQDAPKVYSMNASIYVWREAAIEKGLFGARTALHVMPRERSIDIDGEIDFLLVDMLMARARS